MWCRIAYSGHREGLPRCTAFMYGSNGDESLFLPNYFSIPLCNGMGLNLPMHRGRWVGAFGRVELHFNISK